MPSEQLAPFLERYRASVTLEKETGLDELLVEILRKANEFVPSESGSILLDDPRRKRRDRAKNELRFIATFGEESDRLVGRLMGADEGIVGQVYQNGVSYLSRHVDADSNFLGTIDDEIGFTSKSIVAVPIYIGKEVCGVLELINHREETLFGDNHRDLLEIFAGYTSFTLQNALDARRAQELARRDDLTGLYNDRFLHHQIEEDMESVINGGESLLTMFLDLDHFKAINDEYGHLAGSQVLREVGYVLMREVDQDKTLISRYGGDEFVLMSRGMTLDEGIDASNRIQKAIAEHSFISQEHDIGVGVLNLRGAISASIGLAVVEGSSLGDELRVAKNELLKRADLAMYYSKEHGRAMTSVHDGEKVVSAESYQSVLDKASESA